MIASRFDSFLKQAKSGTWLVFALVGWFCSALTSAAQSDSAAAYTWTTLAGYAGSGSADGIGGTAQFNDPHGVAMDTNGNVYVTDNSNHTIRKITPAGAVSTIAGVAGTPGSTDGVDNNARFNYPCGIAADRYGNLFVADQNNSTIRMLTFTGTNWITKTIAGFPSSLAGTDGTNSTARFYTPQGVAVDNASNVYVADTANHTIRKITPLGTNWVTRTIAGLAGSSGSIDGTNSVARFNYPVGILVDSAGNLRVAGGGTVRKLTVSGTNWIVTTLAGLAGSGGTNDGTGNAARFYSPSGVAMDNSGNIFVADLGGETIRKITSAGVVTTFAGLGGIVGTADGTGANARFHGPYGVAIDAAANLYVSDIANNEIRKITSSAVVTVMAGSTGGAGSANGTGLAARFNGPSGIVGDAAGNLYVADCVNDTIRQVTSSGVVTTIAGLATNAGSADGAGSNARFSVPRGITQDAAGNLYVADTGNHTIRLITPAGSVTTIAGLAGSADSADGTGTGAQFNQPYGITIDGAGNLYVADRNNFTIRKIRPAINAKTHATNWVVTTIAGLAGQSGNTDGTGSDARFSGIEGIAVDAATNLYVPDNGNQIIRKITPVGTNWVVSTIVGVSGNFYYPAGIAVDGGGNLYVADQDNYTIRKIVPVGANWVTSTIGGVAGTYGSADGAGNAARFLFPFGITVDSAGNLYVTDTSNHTIRKGIFTAYAPINAVAYIKPPMTGKLAVTLLPPEANGQWRFAWEQIWHESGQVVSNLAQDNYPIQFRQVPGYLTLQTNFTVSVVNGQTSFITNQYYPTLNDGSGGSLGSLTVNIGPNQVPGSGWRFLGETAWRAPGSAAANLLPDVYFVEFEPVSGRSKPDSRAARVYAGLATIISGNYLLAAAAPPGMLLPFPVPPGNIGNLTYPFGFNGQLQSDIGYGSGVKVQTNVVLTAAHLVFNDQTLSYVSQAFWYFQRAAGTYEPEPLAARGWYVLGGYAAQRTNDLQFYAPDQSTPQSRNLDVAALYFLTAIGGSGYNGHGGYLPSDSVPNPWLTGNSLKMLVGYPVDGAGFGDASIMPGVMYQTDPQPYALTRATDPVANQQVYIATWFLSYPGNSGGPVYARFNGNYYPVGVYLGTLFNGSQPYASAVRAIDSAVVNLITNAAYLGDTGTNYAGGGVLTIIPSQAINAANPGYLQFTLSPPAAVAAGAGWRLTGDAAYSSATNYTRAVLTTNSFGVEFKPIVGWNVPGNQSITVIPGQITTYTATYTSANGAPASPVLVANINGLGITGTTGTVYRLERRISLTSGSWLPVSTNTITTTGFNLILTNPATNGSVNFYRAVWLP